MTERMEMVLLALLAREEKAEPWENPSMTGNEIGLALGFRHGMEGQRHARDGRSMGPANRVIGCLTSLHRQGMVRFARRRDGRSGTAYGLTEEGLALAFKLKEVREERKMADDAKTADADEKKVWALDGIDTEGTLDPIRAGNVMYAPGTRVTIAESDEMYPGEEGVVQAVGMGKGFYSGPTYDVLVDGTEYPHRLSEDDID